MDEKIEDLKPEDRKGYRHAKHYLRYHLIFSTKYRRKCLNQIRNDVFDAFNYVNDRSWFNIKKMNIDKDHIHFLITIPPTMSVGGVVNRLKSMSTNYLWNKQKEYLSQYYWGKKRMIWTHGYYCSTLGDVSEKKVDEYIENQGK